MSAFLQNPEVGFWVALPSWAHPRKKEDLFLYLIVSTTTMSVALIQEENRVQFPIYYVSQTFQGAEAKYPCMEKIIFALIVASWKLRPYF